MFANQAQPIYGKYNAHIALIELEIDLRLQLVVIKYAYDAKPTINGKGQPKHTQNASIYNTRRGIYRSVKEFV